MRRGLLMLLLCLLPLQAGAFPDTPILDAFNRANEDPLSGSGNWAGPILPGMAQMKGVSNALMQSTLVPSASGSSYWAASTFSGSVQAYSTIPTWWANASSDFWLWCQGANENTASADGYQLYVPHGGNWLVVRVDNTVGTQLGAALGTQTVNSGDGIGLDCGGTGTLQAWYHAALASTWSTLGTSRSDTTYTSGHIGVSKGFVDTTSVLDDFGGGTVHVDSGCDRLLLEDGASYLLVENADVLTVESGVCGGGAPAVVPIQMLMGVGL